MGKPCQLFHTKLESKLVPVSRLAMNRFLPMTTGPSVSVANLESALKHLSLSQKTPVFGVFQVVSEKQSGVGRMQHAIKWHDTRQREMLSVETSISCGSSYIPYKSRFKYNWTYLSSLVWKSWQGFTCLYNSSSLPK